MKKNYTLFLLTAVCFINLNLLKAQAVNSADSLALVDLYNSTNGAQWYHHSNWLTGNVASWYGITVTGTRVTGISIEADNVSGTLPSSIGNLTALINLDLGFNKISGSIPSSTGNLIKLTSLALNSNGLTGSIPSNIANCTALTNLNLFMNKLSGSIPESIGNLTNLTLLTFAFNKLSGTIPSSVGNLVNLTNLSLFDNNFSGSIPSSVGNLKALYSLELYDNKLTGSIPTSINNLQTLRYVNLQNNMLTGAIPSSLGTNPNITVISLENNQLTGSIPPSLKNLSILQELYLSHNQLTGRIPTLQNNSLRFLYLDHNQLSGKIPIAFGNELSLEICDLSNNNLSGNIPDRFSDFNALQSLYLDSNNLGGEFSISLLKKPYGYTVLTLNSNHFTLSHNVYPSDIKTIIGLMALENNNFTFDGLEYIEKKVALATYSPQAQIKIYKYHNALAVSAGGTLANNTYRWYKENGSLVATITGDAVFNPTETGNYYAEITNAIATDLTLHTDTIHYNVPDALNSLNATIANNSVIKFKAYPNPATNILYIEVNANTIINLTDENGKVLVSKSVSVKGAIDVSHIAEGVYYLQNISTGEKQKVVVMH